MSKKGGYVIVDLKGKTITAGTPFTLDGVTARLDRAKNKACLLSGFAIGNDEKRDVFVDLQKTEDGYIALFGQYTITIEDDEVTITDGGILMDSIVDSQGHKRFIEGNGVPTTIEGFTFSYCKWSLSGTHLMIVLAGSVANETAFTYKELAIFNNIPRWVIDKIIVVFSNKIIRLSVGMYASSGTQQTLGLFLAKPDGNRLSIETTGDSVILNADRSFRAEFDLLIDSAE